MCLVHDGKKIHLTTNCDINAITVFLFIEGHLTTIPYRVHNLTDKYIESVIQII